MGKPRGSGRLLTGVVAILLATAACTSGASTSPSASSGGGASVAPSTEASVAPSTGGSSVAPSTAASGGVAVSAGSFKLGYSNCDGVGDGFRDEQVCTAKAEWKGAGGDACNLTV